MGPLCRMKLLCSHVGGDSVPSGTHRAQSRPDGCLQRNATGLRAVQCHCPSHLASHACSPLYSAITMCWWVCHPCSPSPLTSVQVLQEERGRLGEAVQSLMGPVGEKQRDLSRDVIKPTVRQQLPALLSYTRQCCLSHALHHSLFASSTQTHACVAAPDAAWWTCCFTRQGRPSPYGMQHQCLRWVCPTKSPTASTTPLTLSSVA